MRDIKYCKPKRTKLRNILIKSQNTPLTSKVFKRTDPVSVEQQDKMLTLKNIGLL